MSVGSPQQVVRVREALQQQTEHVTDGSDGGLRQRRVSQRQQQLGDELKLPQQFGIFGRLTVPAQKDLIHLISRKTSSYSSKLKHICGI